MSDHDAVRTDPHANRRHTVTADSRPTPTMRCPRSARKEAV